jgi:hypothetical protein
MHTYERGGRYEVVLTVSSRLGTDIVRQTIGVSDVVRRPRERLGP